MGHTKASIALDPSAVVEAKEKCAQLLHELATIVERLSKDGQHKATCYGCSAESTVNAAHKLFSEFVSNVGNGEEKVDGAITVPLDVFLCLARQVCAEVLHDYERFATNPAAQTADVLSAAGMGMGSTTPKEGEKWN